MRRSWRLLLALTSVLLVSAVLVPSLAVAENLRVTGASFADAAHGYVVGGRIDAGGGFASYTGDGGATWTHASMSLWQVGVGAQSVSSASAIGSFSRAAYSTSNSGATWQRTGEMVPGVGTLNMADVERLPDGTLVAVGVHVGSAAGDLATIWRSTDGGTTWSNRFDGPIQPPASPDEDPPSTIARLESVDFTPDGQVGWAVGTEWSVVGTNQSFITFKQALVYKTTDSGSTWTTQTVAAGAPVTTVSVVNAFTAWLSSTTGQIFKTVDGVSWPQVGTSGVTGNLSKISIAGLDANTAVVAGDASRGIRRTVDGGTNWTQVLTPGQHVYSLAVADPTTIYAGGNNVFFKSLDSGATWVSAPISSATVLTLQASAAQVNPGQSVNLSGTLKTAAGTGLVGKTVTLQYSPNGTTWNVNGTTTTGAGGAFNFSVSPTVMTYYRVSYAGEFGLDPSLSPSPYPSVSVNAPPVTNASGVPAGWSLTDVTVALSATDDSGITPTTYYRVGGTTSPGTSVPISAEGQTTVEYWSVDNLGAEETPHKSAVVKIDKFAPSVPGQPAASNQTASSVTLSWAGSTDAGSGVKGYNVYNGATKVVSLSSGTSVNLTGLAAATYSFTVSSVDNTDRESGQSPARSVTITAGGGGGRRWRRRRPRTRPLRRRA